MVSAGRLVAIVSPDSAPIKRMVQEARERGTLIDATYGRKTRAVLVMDTGHVIWSTLTPEQQTLFDAYAERRNDSACVYQDALCRQAFLLGREVFR